MYLMHHEGEGAGPLFIKNQLVKGSGGEAGLRRKFEIQLGRKGQVRVCKLVDAAGGDVAYAYRRWLASYIDENFRQAGRYFCSGPILARELSGLMDLAGGEAID